MEKRQNLYEEIRDDILRGKFNKNEKLTELKLSEIYGVSRTPIREVLKQLEFEYLVKKGRVYNPTAEDYRNLFEMRVLIESYAAERAVYLFGNKDIDELKAAIKSAKGDGDPKHMMTANKKFHEKLLSALDNPFLREAYDRMNSIIHFFSHTVVKEQRPDLIKEHEEIAAALEKRDSEKLKELITIHLNKDLEFTLHHIKKVQSPDIDK